MIDKIRIQTSPALIALERMVDGDRSLAGKVPCVAVGSSRMSDLMRCVRRDADDEMMRRDFERRSRR